tara:strand:+ start:435 stop:623 length:189 start_codon:yes stop_codon:yes gene_type:complete
MHANTPINFAIVLALVLVTLIVIRLFVINLFFYFLLNDFTNVQRKTKALGNKITQRNINVRK